MTLKIKPADVVIAAEPVTDTEDAPHPVEVYIDQLRALIERWQGGLTLTQADKDFLTAPPLYVMAPYDLASAVGEHWDMRLTDVAARLIVLDAKRRQPRAALSTVMSIADGVTLLRNAVAKHQRGRLLDEIEKIQIQSLRFPASDADKALCAAINNANDCSWQGVANTLLGRDAALRKRCGDALGRVRAATAKAAWVDPAEIDLLKECGSEIATKAVAEYEAAKAATPPNDDAWIIDGRSFRGRR